MQIGKAEWKYTLDRHLAQVANCYQLICKSSSDKVRFVKPFSQTFIYASRKLTSFFNSLTPIKYRKNFFTPLLTNIFDKSFNSVQRSTFSCKLRWLYRLRMATANGQSPCGGSRETIWSNILSMHQVIFVVCVIRLSTALLLINTHPSDF